MFFFIFVRILGFIVIILDKYFMVFVRTVIVFLLRIRRICEVNIDIFINFGIYNI